MRKNYAVILAAVLLVLGRQLLIPGYYFRTLDDAAMLPKFTAQIAASFGQGVLYPRWMPADFAGYGSPVFLYYSPLAFFLTALLRTAGLSVSYAYTLLSFAALLVGAVFVYRLVKEDYSDRAAAAAALCFILFPSRVMDLYIIKTPAGRLSMAWMPMALFYLRRYAGSPSPQKGAAAAALSYSGLVLTHVVSAFLFAPFLFAYGIFCGRGGGRGNAAGKTASVIAAGLCLSSVFLLPVLMESRYVHMEYLTLNNNFKYWNNFIFGGAAHPRAWVQEIKEMVRKNILLDLAVLGTFHMLARRQPGRPDPARPLTALSSVSVAACLFIMSSPSGFLWAYLPGLSTVQFPSRFTAIYMVFLPVIFGAAVERLNFGRLLPLFAVAALAAVVLFHDWGLSETFPPMSEAEGAKPGVQSNLTEYLPKTVDPAAVSGLMQDGPKVSADSGTVRVINWGQEFRALSFESHEGGRLRVRTFYFPGWKAWVDGVETPLSAEDRTGAITMSVPPGRHDVVLKFTDTPPMRYGALLSVFTAVVLLLPALRKKTPP